MSESIYFVGDPGPGKVNMLSIIRQFGIEPRRVNANEQVPFRDADDEVLAIVIGPEVEDRHSYVTSLRERVDLQGIPLLSRVEKDDDSFIESAIMDGVDDVLPDGSEWHFGAFLVHLSKTDDWKMLRAPQGLVILAEKARSSRIRVASNLKKNGYDVRFAGSSDELISSVKESKPRIVVCSLELANEAVNSLVENDCGLQGDGVPWIVFGGNTESERLSSFPGLITRVGTIRDIGNTEQLTFVINEVVAPEKPEGRITPRLLFGTTVHFGAEDGVSNLCGYTYNINKGGVFIRTLIPLPKGTRVKLSFKAPVVGKKVNATGQVVWVREYSDANGPMSPPGMGLQLIEWEGSDREIYETGYQKLRADQEGERITMEAPSLFKQLQDSAPLNDAPTSLPAPDIPSSEDE